MFARNISAVILSFEDCTPADADVVADRNGKTVDDVFLSFIRFFECFRKDTEQIFPYGAVDSMDSAVQTAFAQHVRNISVFFEEIRCVADISSEKTLPEYLRLYPLLLSVRHKYYKLL